MQEQMNEQMRQQQQGQTSVYSQEQSTSNNKKAPAEDYIDFEEIKEN